MGIKLSPKEIELYKRTDEVLHYIWDPIGVSDSPYARDEYWNYLPHVFNLLIKNESKNVIVNYLLSVETERMELNPNKSKAEYVVDILYEYKQKIFSEPD